MSKSELFRSVRNAQCIACGASPSDVCHIRSRGAGGGDQEWNLISLCRGHHISHHSIGWKKFTEKHPEVLRVLAQKGWEFNSQNQLRRI